MKSRLLQSRHMSFLSVLFLFKNSSWCVVIHCGIGIAGLAKPARLLFLAAVEFLSSFFFTFSIFRAKDFYSIIIIGSDFISNYLLVHCSFSRAFKCKASSQSSWPPVDQHWLHTVWKLCQKVSFCKTVSFTFIFKLWKSSFGLKNGTFLIGNQLRKKVDKWDNFRGFLSTVLLKSHMYIWMLLVCMVSLRQFSLIRLSPRLYVIPQKFAWISFFKALRTWKVFPDFVWRRSVAHPQNQTKISHLRSENH